jgi:hypothetical protein
MRLAVTHIFGTVRVLVALRPFVKLRAAQAQGDLGVSLGSNAKLSQAEPVEACVTTLNDHPSTGSG